MDRKQKAWYAKLTGWDKFYIGVGAMGFGIYLYTTVDWNGSKAAAAQVGHMKHSAKHSLSVFIFQ